MNKWSFSYRLTRQEKKSVGAGVGTAGRRTAFSFLIVEIPSSREHALHPSLSMTIRRLMRQRCSRPIDRLF